MAHRFALVALTILALPVLGCAPGATPPDADARDASTEPDVGVELDVGVEPDAGAARDVGAELDAAMGSGTDVGVLDAALDGGGADGGLGVPITAPDDVWTWIDVDGARCDDGSPTGVGVSLHPGSDDLLVFFTGGGACWDDTTCLVLRTAASGPYGAAQFAATSAALAASPIFDRTRTDNPFRDFSFVFVPYCTGDLHAGSHVATYTSGGASRTFHHVGATNVERLLPRLVATWPGAARVVLAGSSTGGFGAVFHHAHFADVWPAAERFVVDDAGPLLPDDTISPTLRTAWNDAWALDALLDPLCGAACDADLSALHAAMATARPADRVALLSSTEDAVMRTYFSLSAPQFAAALDALVTEHTASDRPMRALRVVGTSHTLLPTASAATLRWLGEMLASPTWSNVGP